MCDLRIDFSQLHLPHFDIPPGMTADEYLRKICEDSLARQDPGCAGEREHQRLDYELDVIRRTKYATYFLVVWDIAQFVRRNNIELAVRGSAAASLVLYLVGVTDVNPLTYSLVFERFLNVERKQMPDIDMDFQDDRRDEVLRYVVEKYGSDHVAQIITFGTMGAKASVRDVGRALNMPYVEVDRVARLIPNRLKIKLDEALETSPELHEIYSADPSIKELVDKARGLEGIVRHSSTHAAGVVMSGERLDEIVPMQTSGRGGEDDGSSLPTTQYAMDPVEELGLLKIDFLGLINLTILAKTRELIRETRGIDVDHRALPLDDLKTYELLSRGETGGVFQLEGAGMTRYIKELKPAQFGEIASMIALYRPGPMDHIGAYIDAKHGRAPVEHLHDDFRDILEESYGVIVFQDQVLLITQKFAGYTLGEADSVRRAMGKKIPAVMAQEREKFIAGALAQGYEQELAERVFSLIEPFAGYAFNKAHSVCYALISYWTAYFKANYPQEYMACLLNAFSENLEKVASIVSECKRLKIPVLPPDILKSEPFYSIEVGEDGEFAIRAGLASIKNVGTGSHRGVRGVESVPGGTGREHRAVLSRGRRERSEQKESRKSHQGWGVRRVRRPGGDPRLDRPHPVGGRERGAAEEFRSDLDVRHVRRDGADAADEHRASERRDAHHGEEPMGGGTAGVRRLRERRVRRDGGGERREGDHLRERRDGGTGGTQGRHDKRPGLLVGRAVHEGREAVPDRQDSTAGRERGRVRVGGHPGGVE